MVTMRRATLRALTVIALLIGARDALAGPSGDYLKAKQLVQRAEAMEQLSRQADVDTLLRYALAVAFNSSRAAGPYEQRGEAMAEDLADGLGPDRVRAFREAQLAVAGEPGLADTLLARFPSIYGRVMVGLGEPLAKSPDGVFFLIGPEAQFTSLEALIAQTEAPTVVERLAPRDFWLVSSPPAGGS